MSHYVDIMGHNLIALSYLEGKITPEKRAKKNFVTGSMNTE